MPDNAPECPRVRRVWGDDIDELCAELETMRDKDDRPVLAASVVAEGSGYVAVIVYAR